MAWTFGRAKPSTHAADRTLDVRSIHDEHADFVWRSLLRLGVREVDAEDALQSVFMVVHRRLSTYDGSSKMTTWLFGISLRIASAYRRKVGARREDGTLLTDPEDARASPAEQLEGKEARGRLQALLDAMDPEKRAVFVMFELDEMSCEQIAEVLGVPVGTVYSRLSAARKAFAAALARLDARDASQAALARGGAR
jgi:RNA polymerase sigma-70 factor (ECF subfamily)